MRLDGQELGPQRRHFGRGEAGGQETVEALRRRLHAARCGAAGRTIGVRVRTVGFVRTGSRGSQRGGGGGGGAGFGFELGGRQLRVRGDGAVDVEPGGRFAGRGEPERGVEGRVGGQERAGVDEAEGAGGERGRQVWADEGFERGRGGGAGGGDGEGQVGEGGREADYEGEGWDGGWWRGGRHCCLFGGLSKMLLGVDALRHLLLSVEYRVLRQRPRVV